MTINSLDWMLSLQHQCYKPIKDLLGAVCSSWGGQFGIKIPRRNETVATDTVMSDTPAVHDGSAMAQFVCEHLWHQIHHAIH